MQELEETPSTLRMEEEKNFSGMGVIDDVTKHSLDFSNGMSMLAGVDTDFWVRLNFAVHAANARWSRR